MSDLDVNALLADIMPNKPGSEEDDALWTPFSGPHLVFGDSLKESHSPRMPSVEEKRKQAARRRKTSLTVEIENSSSASPRMSPQPSPHGSIGQPSPGRGSHTTMTPSSQALGTLSPKIFPLVLVPGSSPLQPPGQAPTVSPMNMLHPTHKQPQMDQKGSKRSPKPQARPTPQFRTNGVDSPHAGGEGGAIHPVGTGLGPSGSHGVTLEQFMPPQVMPNVRMTVPRAATLPNTPVGAQTQAQPHQLFTAMTTPTGIHPAHTQPFFQAPGGNADPPPIQISPANIMMANQPLHIRKEAFAMYAAMGPGHPTPSNSSTATAASSPGPTPSPKHSSKASKMRPVCLDWLQGKCNTKRWSCKFAHPQLPAQVEGAGPAPAPAQTSSSVPATPTNMSITVGSHPMTLLSQPLVMSPGAFNTPMVLLATPTESPSHSATANGPLSPPGGSYTCVTAQGQQYMMIPIPSPAAAPAMIQPQPPPSPGSAPSVCSVWELTGTCKFGDFCRDFHPPLDDRIPRACLNPRDNPFSQKAAQAREQLKLQEGGEGSPTHQLSPPAVTWNPTNPAGMPVMVGRTPPTNSHPSIEPHLSTSPKGLPPHMQQRLVAGPAQS